MRACGRVRACVCVCVCVRARACVLRRAVTGARAQRNAAKAKYDEDRARNKKALEELDAREEKAKRRTQKRERAPRG